MNMKNSSLDEVTEKERVKDAEDAAQEKAAEDAETPVEKTETS